MAIVIIRSPAHKPWRSRGTYRLIEAGLRRRWENVYSIRAADEVELNARLQPGGSAPPPFVFNIAEYLDERHTHGFIPGLLDSWGIPHLGSSAASVSRCLDWGLARELLLQKGLPTPRSFVTKPPDPQMHAHAESIGYPLLVKPLRKVGRAGVGKAILAHDPETLKEAVRRLSRTYLRPLLVEEYIDGEHIREFKVGVVGNTRRMHLPIEIDWARMSMNARISGIDAMRIDPEIMKPVLESGTAAALHDLADRTFDALEASDLARVDIRARGDQPFVLGINVLPGLGPSSVLPLAAWRLYGLDHGDFIRLLAKESIMRQGLLAIA